MGQTRYLVDSNAVIDYLGKKLSASGMDFMDSIINAVPNVSVISKIEVLGYNAPREHYKLLSEFMADSTVMDLTDNIVDKTIEIRKQHKTKLPDAIIASTAIVYGLDLISRNTSDFKDIKELTIIDPHSL
ncbi:MAG: type II toxin-antitoxin system VapC family toxin [Chitinophagales bacterium]